MIMTITIKHRYLTTAIALCSGIALPALAATIETVIVTAQARVQTAEEVPIAIQVVTQEQIATLGANDLSNMNGYFPGFTISGEQATQPNFALRGIGTSDFGIGTDAPVGVYVDGVYTGKTGGALMNFNDIQRVEVLKGPQGTLFGRNSAAGAIAIYTNEPNQTLGGQAHARFGRFGTRYFDGFFNTPLTDDTALRLSFVNSRSDGWTTNRTDDTQVGGDHAWGSRLAFKWSPSDDTQVILSWEHEDLDQLARPAFGVVRLPAGTHGTVPADPATFIDPIDATLENDSPSSETRKFDGLTLRFETQFGDLTFNSLTAYRHFKTYNREDNDGTANPATYLDTANGEKNSSWQQEFKLSAENDLLDWVTGLSLFYSKASQRSDVTVNTDSLDTLIANQVGDPAALPYLYASGVLGGDLYGIDWLEQMKNNNTAKAIALYGDAIWHLTPDTNLTTGLRATRDYKRASWYVPPRTSAQLDALGGDLAFAADYLNNNVAPGLGDPLLAQNIIFADAAALASTKTDASHSWTDLSPRIVLDHRLSPDTMLFASASRGYQAGGYNVFVPDGRFKPEHMTNYEIGVKNYFPQLGLTLNASVFHYRFTDLQEISLVSTGGGIPVYRTESTDQRATGLDLDASFKIADWVRIFTAAEYINQRYDKKIYASHFGGELDLEDQPVGTPLLTAMAGVTFSWDLLGGRSEFTLQGTHTSEQRCNDQIREEFGCLDHGAVHTGEAMTRVDARLGWDTADHNFGIALLVNNVFDKQYLQSTESNASALGGQGAWTLGTPYVSSITPPRFVGVEVKAGF